MKETHAKFSETRLGSRLTEDPRYRLVFFAALGMSWNLLYAVFNLVLGIVYRSGWFVILSLYYFSLGLLRLFTLASERRPEEKRSLKRTQRLTGVGLIVLAVVLSLIVMLTIRKAVGTSYHMIVMIAIAAFTFFIVVKAIVNAVKAHRSGDPYAVILRNIALAVAVGSILSLERSMLATFDKGGGRFVYTMEGATGLGGFLIVLGLGISMVIAARGKPQGN